MIPPPRKYLALILRFLIFSVFIHGVRLHFVPFCPENKTILKTTFCVGAPVVSSVRFVILLPEQKVTPV